MNPMFQEPRREWPTTWRRWRRFNWREDCSGGPWGRNHLHIKVLQKKCKSEKGDKGDPCIHLPSAPEAVNCQPANRNLLQMQFVCPSPKCFCCLFLRCRKVGGFLLALVLISRVTLGKSVSSSAGHQSSHSIVCVLLRFRVHKILRT